jgi:hypothetical protein
MKGRLRPFSQYFLSSTLRYRYGSWSIHASRLVARARAPHRQIPLAKEKTASPFRIKSSAYRKATVLMALYLLVFLVRLSTARNANGFQRYNDQASSVAFSIMALLPETSTRPTDRPTKLSTIIMQQSSTLVDWRKSTAGVHTKIGSAEGRRVMNHGAAKQT